MNVDPLAGAGDVSATSILRDWQQIPFGTVALYIALAWIATEFIKRCVPWIAARVPDRFRFAVLPWAPILRLLVTLLTLFLILPLVVDTRGEKLLALFAAISVALGFAFKDYISSLIAGIVLLYEHPYRVGDWVTVEGAYGEVKAINFRALELLTPDDTSVIVPHSKLWTTSFYNDNSGHRELQCAVHIYLQPDHDGVTARQKLHDVAATSSYVSLRKPISVVAEEQPWGTHYKIRAYPMDARDQFQFVTDLTLRAKAELLAANYRLATAPASVAAE